MDSHPEAEQRFILDEIAQPLSLHRLSGFQANRLFGDFQHLRTLSSGMKLPTLLGSARARFHAAYGAGTKTDFDHMYRNTYCAHDPQWTGNSLAYPPGMGRKFQPRRYSLSTPSSARYCLPESDQKLQTAIGIFLGNRYHWRLASTISFFARAASRWPRWMVCTT